MQPANILQASLTSLVSLQVLKLFEDAKEAMEDESSQYRRDLNKLTLVFSHILSEFKVP